ncbi:MAG: triose-phosphate transporter family-domain-containing protein [Benniella sp.]|nr:MAG: triose-phosphate transporter family-domain-containing protein [Benniella sp.]
MTDSFESSSARTGSNENGPAGQEATYHTADLQEAEHGQTHHREDSISGSESDSSDDGIEWEGSGRYESPEHTSDGSDDGSDGEYQDTRGLLASSSNARVGGMGMGMRVGETGTGTTIGLDFEFNTRSREEDYNILPLANVGGRGRGSSDGRQGSEDTGSRRGGKPRKSIGRDRRRSMHTGAPALGISSMITEQERLLAKRQIRIKMLWNIFYVLAWYGCSTSLSFYNKWLFSPLHHNFRFPLFTTCLHMVAQFGLSSLTLWLIPSLRPSSAPSVKDFGTKIVPCAVASGLDVGLSNNSLKSITLAFYTMCKSSSLAFVLLFAFAFKLERPTWTLAGVIAVICVGLFMMVMSEVDFVLVGFIQVMLASVLGGLRWSLTQLLLERTDTKTGSLANPISTIFFLSPIMGVCLCIVAGVFEGYRTIFSSEFFQTLGSSLGTLGLLFLGGTFAFAMVLAEFNLIARTSVVSLSVLGIVKEVMTIIISSLVFHDQLTVINILGLFITLSGIGFYHHMKLRELKAKARKTASEIVEISQSSTLDRFSESMDQLPVRQHRKQWRSERPRHKSSRRSVGVLGRGDINGIVEDDQEGSNEALIAQASASTVGIR